MAVAFQAQAVAATTSAGATSFTSTNLTVASGSNLALIVAISFNTDPGAFTKKNWDDTGTPQALTLISNAASSDAISRVYLFGLVNPNVGANTLALTWTNNVRFSSDVLSFTGVDQTGGTTTFKNANSNAVSTANISVAVTSPSGDFAVAGFATFAGGFSTGGVGTEVYFNNLSLSSAMRYTTGIGSTTLQQNSTAAAAVAVGCDIAAAAAVGLALSDQQLVMM